MRLVEFPLKQGKGVIVVEVEDEALVGGRPLARPGEIIVKAKHTFEDAVTKIQPAADILLDRLRGLSQAPEEISVEFGCNLNSEAGAVIAKAGIAAHFKVTLKWKQKNPQTP